MMKKIQIELPNTCLIEEEVEIGENVIIHPNTILRGKTIIEDNVVIGPNSEIINSRIGSNSKVIHSLVIDSIIKENVSIGPFAHLRNNANIEANARIGNYVEIKNSFIDEGTKISHLSYVGDANIGKKVNVGAGVIFANYDGKRKNKTLVGDNVFIGSNSTLIAPLKIENNSLVGAGSTINKDVPFSSLAIARAYQINKEKK